MQPHPKKIDKQKSGGWVGIPLASISLLNVDFPTFTSINYMPQKVGVGGGVGGRQPHDNIYYTTVGSFM